MWEVQACRAHTSGMGRWFPGSSNLGKPPSDSYIIIPKVWVRSGGGWRAAPTGATSCRVGVTGAPSPSGSEQVGFRARPRERV